MLLRLNAYTEEVSPDPLREALAPRTLAKIDPTLKRKGRLIVEFKTIAEANAALEAVLAVPQ